MRKTIARVKRLGRQLLADIRTTANNVIVARRYRCRARNIRQLKGVASGGTVYILATGPSASLCDLRKLEGHTVIAVNAAIRFLDQFSPKLCVHLIVDTLRVQEIGLLRHPGVSTYVRSFTSPGSMTISKAAFGKLLAPEDIFIRPALRWQMGRLLPVLDRDPRVGGFSEDLERCYWDTGNTVAFAAIQLASYMEATRIVLLGVDMNFTSSSATCYSAYVAGMHIADPIAIHTKMQYSLSCFEAYGKRLNKEGSPVVLYNASSASVESFLPKIRYDDAIETEVSNRAAT